tara:strand:+ start:364 stop:522 length:159 start_codon:yes stop_codon:yes gene_type:complete
MNECANCNGEYIYEVEDLPVGTRGFCTEECYCEYVGLVYNGEGYYGLKKVTA